MIEKGHTNFTEILEEEDNIWGSNIKIAGCIKCYHAHLINDSRMGSICPSCGQGKLIPQSARLRKEPPEKIVPFEKSQEDLHYILKNYIKDVWFRSDDMKITRLLERIVPVFWPMWVIESKVTGIWHGETGFEYQVKTTQEMYRKNVWTKRDVTQICIKWELRTGQLYRHYDNIQLNALSNHENMEKLIDFYDYKKAVPFKQKDIENSYIRVPDLTPEALWPEGKDRLDIKASEECRIASGAQHIRSFSINGTYEDTKWTQLLLPMYFTWYTDDRGKIHPLYINGQTGKIGGARMCSEKNGWRWSGISSGIALALILLGILVSFAGTIFPPVAFIGLLLDFVGVIMLLLSPMPLAWAWFWNTKEKNNSKT